MDLLRNALRFFLPMACVWSLAVGLTVLVQYQVLRAQANEPQLQIAGDTAQRLAGGADPKSVLPPATVELAQSPSPFVAIYDAAGAPLASTGTLDGAAPRLPAGVLEAAQRSGGSRISWQPRAGLRQALVIVPLRSGGFVVSGRSLHETEALKLQVLHLALMVWLAGLGACLLVALMVPKRRN